MMPKAQMGETKSPQILINQGSATDPKNKIMLKSTIHGCAFSSYHTPIFKLKQSKFVY